MRAAILKGLKLVLAVTNVPDRRVWSPEFKVVRWCVGGGEVGGQE